MSNYPSIELRLHYPGHPSIALIAGLNRRCELDRVYCADYLLFVRRERMNDGRQAQVYALPLIDAVYEVRETLNGCRAQRYVATREGDPTLYIITRTQVETIAENATTIKAVISRARRNVGDVLRQEVGDAKKNR